MGVWRRAVRVKAIRRRNSASSTATPWREGRKPGEGAEHTYSPLICSLTNALKFLKRTLLLNTTPSTIFQGYGCLVATQQKFRRALRHQENFL